VIADAAKVSRLLKTARGQIDGILRMIEEDRYCMDVSNQIQATASILRKANAEVLKAHLRSCVRDAFSEGSETDRSEKIEELIGIFEKNDR